MANEKYRIRLARLEELPMLNAIEAAASTLFENTKYASEVDQESLPLEILSEQQRKQLVWVAVDESDRPAGFALVLILDDRAHLHELSVAPSHGRQGIGTRLIDEVCAWAKGAGYSGVTLSTYLDIVWNAPFYRRLGFVEMKEEGLGEGLKNIRMKEAEAGLSITGRIIMIRPL